MCLNGDCEDDASQCNGEFRYNIDSPITSIDVPYNESVRGRELVVPILQYDQLVGRVLIPPDTFPNGWTLALRPSSRQPDITSGCNNKVQQQQASPTFDLIAFDSHGHERAVSGLRQITLQTYIQSNASASDVCMSFAQTGDDKFQCLARGRASDQKVTQTRNHDVLLLESRTDHFTSFVALLLIHDDDSNDCEDTNRTLWIISISLISFAICFVLSVGLIYLKSKHFRALVKGFSLGISNTRISYPFC